MGSQPPSKRSRYQDLLDAGKSSLSPQQAMMTHDERTESTKNPLMTIRKRSLRRNPEYAYKAQEIIELYMVPSTFWSSSTSTSNSSNTDSLPTPITETSSSLSSSSSKSLYCMVPMYVHQLFPLESIFGYLHPLLRIFYSDPEGYIGVIGYANGVKIDALVPSPDMDGTMLRIPPDNLFTCLKLALPLNFPEKNIVTKLDPSLTLHPSFPLVPSQIAKDLQWYPASPSGLSSVSSSSVPWRPYGPCVHSYTVPSSTPSSSSLDRNFSVFRWNINQSIETQEYHDRLATLAMWFIETASAIDLKDERWSVFCLYELSSSSSPTTTTDNDYTSVSSSSSSSSTTTLQSISSSPVSSSYQFVGYATVYRYTNPLRKQSPDAYRLGQLLILPRYQRQGHGQQILYSIQSFLEETDAYELTIESPCEGMVKLRDYFDIVRAYRMNIFNYLPGWGNSSSNPETVVVSSSSSSSTVSSIPTNNSIDNSLSSSFIRNDITDKDLEIAKRKLRITNNQVYRCYEALLFARILRSSNDIMKQFRLTVKRRIFSHDKDVQSLQDPDARKLILEDRYRECEAGYMTALARIPKDISLIRSDGSTTSTTSSTSSMLVNKEEMQRSVHIWKQREAEIAAENKNDDEEEE